MRSSARLAESVYQLLKKSDGGSGWTSRVVWGACLSEPEWAAVRNLAGEGFDWPMSRFHMLAGEQALSGEDGAMGAEFVVRSGPKSRRFYMEYVPFSGGGFFVRDLYFIGPRGNFLVVDDQGAIRWKRGVLFRRGVLREGASAEPQGEAAGRPDPFSKLAKTLEVEVAPAMDPDESLLVWVDRMAPIEVLNGVLETAVRPEIGIASLRLTSPGLSQFFEIETMLTADQALKPRTVFTVQVVEPGYLVPDPSTITPFCPHGKMLKFSGRQLEYGVATEAGTRTFKDLTKAGEHLAELADKDNLLVLDARSGVRFQDLVPVLRTLENCGIRLVLMLGPMDLDYLLGTEHES